MSKISLNDYQVNIVPLDEDSTDNWCEMAPGDLIKAYAQLEQAKRAIESELISRHNDATWNEEKPGEWKEALIELGIFVD